MKCTLVADSLLIDYTTFRPFFHVDKNRKKQRVQHGRFAHEGMHGFKKTASAVQYQSGRGRSVAWIGKGEIVILAIGFGVGAGVDDDGGEGGASIKGGSPDRSDAVRDGGVGQGSTLDECTVTDDSSTIGKGVVFTSLAAWVCCAVFTLKSGNECGTILINILAR